MPRQVQLCSWLRSEADVHVCLVCCCFSNRTFPPRRIYIGVCAITSSNPLQLSVNLQCVSLHQTLVFNRKSFILVVGSTCQSGLLQPTFARPKWIYKKATRSTIFETIRWPQVSRLWRFLPPPQFLWYSCFISFSLLYWLMGNLFRFSKFGARETRGNISIRIGRQTHTTSNPLSRWVTEYMHLRANRSLGFFSVTSFPEGFFPSSVCVCVVGTTQKRPQKDQPVYYSFFSMNQFFIFSIAPPII